MDDKGCLPRESGIRHKCPYRLTTFGTFPALAGEAKIAESLQGDSEAPASPAAAGEGNRVSGGRGAMSDQRFLSKESHISQWRPYRLAALATSPVLTGEAKMP